MLLDFSYMGSAEFEFGALPKSLARVRENKTQYIQTIAIIEEFPSKPVMVLCKETDKEEVLIVLNQLAKKELRLKEYCDLDNYLKGVQSFRTSDFWWDIENDFFFWRSYESYNEAIVKLLLSSPQKV